MDEKIKKIAKSIQTHREFEIEKQASVYAFGRYETSLNGKAILLYMVMNPKNYINPYQDNIKLVSRDSKIGGILIQSKNDELYKYTGNDRDGRFYEISVLNKANYQPIPGPNFAADITIEEGNNIANFSSLLEILTEERLTEEFDTEEVEVGEGIIEENDRFRLLKERLREGKGKKQKIGFAKGFIRRSAELRYQPILDRIQEKIKRSNIFKGTLIINGGPGTGKTTSLIQRIKYLISKTIEEEITLNDEQKDVLYNQRTSWIFYSPSELLALYLRNSMVKEGLEADNERVKVWSDHRSQLIKEYKLVNPTSRRPFLIHNKYKEDVLFKNEAEQINSLAGDFMEYFVNFQRDKIEDILKLDITELKMGSTGANIIKFLREKSQIDSIVDIIRLFLNLENIYKSEINKLLEGHQRLIENLAINIFFQLEKSPERIVELKDFFQNSSDEGDLTDLDAEDEQETDPNINETDFAIFFISKLKPICRKIAWSKFDENIKLSKNEEDLIELIPELKDQTGYEEIGRMQVIKSAFEPIIGGVVNNVLRKIPSIYKNFRKEIMSSEKLYFEKLILSHIVKEENNQRIHPDEQSFLLFFVNSICFEMAKTFKGYFDGAVHSYIDGYKNNYKPVIAVDEATDFSLIDLLAMNSFRHPGISSVTFSGDIMQTMTKNGLKSWEDYCRLSRYSKELEKVKIENLKVSYRQSPSLLRLAKKMYKESTGKNAVYTSFIEIKEGEKEPKPLKIVSRDEDEKLEWVAERIIEIYHAYDGSIPSIAIFLPKESMLVDFAAKLGGIERLSDVGINVVACVGGQILGDENSVRVFSIDKIKGLEFEAVFFHNIDSLLELDNSEDLLMKFIYVGLSRASFYLGITLNEGFSGKLNFLNKDFKMNERWV